jgi:hypothetical protein
MPSRTFTVRFTAFLVWLCVLAVPSFATPQPAVGFDSVPLFSDFDGDHKLDQAELFSDGAQKSIHVSLGKFAWTSLSFDSGVQDRGRLVSGDIDSDGDADLVWVSQSYPRTFVAWLGDGRGNFSIDTRHDRAPAQAMLETRQQTRLAGDPDDRDSTAVLQTTTVVAAHPSVLLFGDIRSERYTIVPQRRGISATCLSVLRKRGPPSHFA